MKLLEYPITHPYPKERIFTVFTVIIFTVVLPLFILINFATTGYELVPTLSPEFYPNNTIPTWMKSRYLQTVLGREAPPCQPKDLGRGDVIRLTPSIFEYTIQSAWRKTNQLALNPKDEVRIAYKGASFSACYIYEIGFDYSWIDHGQTVTIAVKCPSDPLSVFMTTQAVFSDQFTKDMTGQYYGYDVDLYEGVDGTSHSYQRAVFAVLDIMSTDALAMFQQVHSGTRVIALSTRLNATYHIVDGVIFNYANGTDEYADSAGIYYEGIYNLAAAVVNAVQLDLKSMPPNNIFLNSSAIKTTFVPNLAPNNISASSWHPAHFDSWHYGSVVEPYSTYAQMFLAGYPKNITLDNLTGVPDHSRIVTNYLCPSYQRKPIPSLLASIFVGTATMCISAWAAWKTMTAFVASKIQEPCFKCTCNEEENTHRLQREHSTMVSDSVDPSTTLFRGLRPGLIHRESSLTVEKAIAAD